MTTRDQSGRFTNGSSGNPHGKPSAYQMLRQIIARLERIESVLQTHQATTETRTHDE